MKWQLTRLASTPHRELYKRGVVQTRTAYPDWTLVIEEMTAEADWITAHWRAWHVHWLGRGSATDRRAGRVRGNHGGTRGGRQDRRVYKQQSKVLDG